MNIRKIIWMSFTLLIFTVCSACGVGLRKDVKLVHKIRAVTAKKLQRKKNLYLIGTGAQMMYEIEMLAMGFNYYEEVSINKARELMVYAIKTFLDEINNSEAIRPYLANYPFTAKNVDITIYPHTANGGTLPVGTLYIISSTNGIINYYVNSEGHKPLKRVYRETYQEAVAKLKAVPSL